MSEEKQLENAKIHTLMQESYNHHRSQLIHNTGLDIYKESEKLRRSAIICTIGPSSREVKTMIKLMEAGLDVVRLNFSHGTHEYHQGSIDNARIAAKELGLDIAIALDTKGPEIRCGNFVNNKEVILEQGAKVRITTDEKCINSGTKDQFYVDYKNITRKCQVGGLVYVDNGLVSLRIQSIGDDFLDCVVENSGAVSNHKGCNLPNVNVDLPAISDRDVSDLAFGVKNEVDMIFASFVRKPQDVLDIRKCLLDANEEVGKRIQIISKIENHEGMRNFDAILKVTDGVMVARGDLGIEIPPEKIFLAQKMMISKCNLAGKPIIVATQMLESMTYNPRPTRAEVTDVANAVLDGADCVMLSGETAAGKYPIETVNIMARICREAESARNLYQVFSQLRDALSKPVEIQETIACAAVLAAFEQQARAIIALTNSGNTARFIAKFRPPCPIIAVVGASSRYTARQLRISNGAFAICYDDEKGKKSIDERVAVGIEFGKTNRWVATGDYIVCVHADTMGKGFANLVKVAVVP